jgi:hypothetical protein
MKGLEIARRFFFEWGLPFVQREFPELADRVAAGMMTGGSEVIGADDRYSRDHGWGPQFEIFLITEDFKRHGKRLERVMNQAAPKKFLGYGLHHFGRPQDKVEVSSINAVFLWLFNRKYPPKRARDWFARVKGDRLVDHESRLYFLKHGALFHDALGEFSARKELFSEYPRDVRLKLIANACWDIWSCGEYKFCYRLVYRENPIAVQIALGHFVQNLMRLCFLLNNDFAPYWMWLFHEFKKLPEARYLGPKIRRLTAIDDVEEQKQLIIGVCRYLRKRLVAEGLLPPETDVKREIYGLGNRMIEEGIQDRVLRGG